MKNEAFQGDKGLEKQGANCSGPFRGCKFSEKAKVPSRNQHVHPRTVQGSFAEATVRMEKLAAQEPGMFRP